MDICEAEHVFARELMARLPAVVRIGPYDFRIQPWSHHQASGAARYGEFASVEQIIRLQMDMPTRFKAVDTFFHEVGHAIFWTYGAQDDDKEERLVNMLGSAMCALYRDNPWLLDWVASAKLS